MTKKLLTSFNWLAAGILSWALLVAAVMPNNYFKKLDWASPGVLIIGTLGLLVIINGIQRAARAMSQTNYRNLLIGIGILIVLVQVWVSFHFVSASHADDLFVRNQAIALAQGHNEWNNYFKIYPNNVNTVLLETMLIRLFLVLGIKTPWVMLNVVRFIWIDTGLVSGLFILKNQHHWKPAGLLLMITWLFSFPVYNYGLFAYSDPFVMPIVLNVAALGLVFKNSHGWLRWLAAAGCWILLSAGFFIKSNLIVFWIAVLMILMIASFSRQIRWPLTISWIIGGVVTLFLTSLLFSSGAKRYGYVKDSNQATPATSWIAMSLNPQRQGQYAQVDFFQIRDKAHTANAKNKMATNVIKERVKAYHVTGLAGHFADKMGVFYSHGDFEGTHLIAQWIRRPTWVVHHQRALDFGEVLLTQCWYLALLVGAIWKLFVQKRHLLLTSLFSLILIGLTIFHVVIWEVEARYALPLLPIIFVLGSSGWATLPVLIPNVRQKLLFSWLAVLGVGFCTLSLAKTSQQSPTMFNQIAKQSNGSYFENPQQTISRGKTFDFKIPLNGLATNQLVLYPKSNVPVKITVKSGEKVLRQVKGLSHSAQLTRINYPRTHTKELTVLIKNQSRHAVQYYAGSMNYSAYTGAIKNRPQTYMRYDINFNYPIKTAPDGKPFGIKLIAFSWILIADFLFLVLMLICIWWEPRLITSQNE